MRTAIAALGLAALAACALRGRPPALSPLGDEEAEVYLYLQPFPHEAEPLEIALRSVGLEREDGGLVALELRRPILRGAELRGQRLLALGRVPAGTYRAVVVGVERASLGSGERRSQLLVPDEPVRLALDLRLARRGASVLWLTYQHERAIEQRFAFHAAFSPQLARSVGPAEAGLVANLGSLDLTVIDLHQRQVSGAIATGRTPRGVALDPRAGRAWVALSEEDQLDVVDVTLARSVGRIRLQAGDGPRDLGLSPDGRLLVTANERSRSASFVDTASGLELGRAAVGDDPWSVLMDREGRRAYVFSRRASTVSVLDLANRSRVATLATDPEPLRGTLSRDGRRLFVVHAGSAYLTSFTLPELAPAARLFVGLGATTVLVDPRSELIYVGRGDEPRLAVYDAYSFLPVDEVDLPGPASALAIVDVDNTLYVAIAASGLVAVVDLTTRKTVAMLDTGQAPQHMALPGTR